MKTLLKFSFVALLAVFACQTKTNVDQKVVQKNILDFTSGPLEVISVADYALGYLIKSDTGQIDTTLLANMKRMRDLDQDLRRSGTGECTHYKFLASCVCLCSGTCCTCPGRSIYMAAPISVTSVRLVSGDSTRLNSEAQETDGIKIFPLNVDSLRGDFDLIIDYDGRTFSMPITATPESTLKVRIP